MGCARRNVPAIAVQISGVSPPRHSKTLDPLDVRRHPRSYTVAPKTVLARFRPVNSAVSLSRHCRQVVQARFPASPSMPSRAVARVSHRLWVQFCVGVKIGPVYRGNISIWLGIVAFLPGGRRVRSTNTLFYSSSPGPSGLSGMTMAHAERQGLELRGARNSQGSNPNTGGRRPDDFALHMHLPFLNLDGR